MTAKQRAARARFKTAVTEAKKLRKKNPSLTQAQAVKQAWAIIYSKERKNPIKRIKKAVTDYVSKAKEDIKRGYYGEEYGKKRHKKRVGDSGRKRKHKPTERDILNKIHTVKEKVDRLDEAQHEHMSIGSLKSGIKKKLEKQYGKLATRKLVTPTKRAKNKITKEMRSIAVKIKRIGEI